MKLSIIIALYNTEKYIEKCIRSIYLNNNLSKDIFEVIVINDGSTDNSQVIVEGLMKEFSNIKLINKENGGQSTARNIGFDLAKGDYLFCLDSDDYINAFELLEALGFAIDNQLDMLPICYKILDENYNPIKQNKDNYSLLNNIISGPQFMNLFSISGAMCRYLYKASVIKENKLKLIEGIFHEDEEFVLRFLSYVKRISYKRHLVYYYIVRKNSTVNNKDLKHRKKLLNDIITVIVSLIKRKNQFSGKNEESIGLSKKIEQLLISIFIRMKSDSFSYDEVKEVVFRLKELNLYPIKIKHQNIKFRVAAKFFNSSIFCKLYFKR